MGIFSGLFKSRDKPVNRTAGSNYAFFFGGTTSGKTVTERSAMQMTAVYSCVRILSEAVAGLPLHLYKYTDSGGKAMAHDHPLYRLLHDEPNPEMSSFVFREALMTHLLLWGNAYAQIIRNGKNEIVALYPLMPNKMSVDRDENGRLYTPCPNSQVAGLQQSIMDFQQKNPGIRVTTTGYGICHHLMDEFGLAAPGRLIVGGDSHSTTYGFLNAAGIGIGSTDIAIAMITGKLWFKVPDTIRVDFMGSMRKGVSGKDVALYLVNRIGPNGGSYRAVEFGGSGIANLPINDRKTICNLMAECGAKCGIMPYDELAEQYCIERGIDHANPVVPDADCVYAERFLVDLDAIEPVIAVPHNVHTIKTVRELTGTPIHMAMLGTCTGGKIDDFREAAQVVRAMDGPFKAEVLVVPASQKILLQMMQEGIADLFVRKGATLLPAGCGSCCGSSPGVPRDGFNVISTANRNFLGRMGNVKANIYLASPQVTAYCAMLGCVGDPTEVLA